MSDPVEFFDEKNPKIYFENKDVCDKVSKFLELFEIDMCFVNKNIFFRQKDSLLPFDEKKFLKIEVKMGQAKP